MGRPTLYLNATCHPDRKHYAKALCRSCYVIYRRGKARGTVSRPSGWSAPQTPFRETILRAQGHACKACSEGIDPGDRNQFSVYWGGSREPLGVVCARCRSMLGFLEGTRPSVIQHMLTLLHLALPPTAPEETKELDTSPETQ